MSYVPINYKTWVRSGTGKNIRLTQKEREIWDDALSFQDSRPNDRGHAEVVAYFALKLLEIGADRNVVLPAAILHDIGWSQVSVDFRKMFKDPYHPDFAKVNNPEMRRLHQKESVRLAIGILADCEWPKRYHAAILGIVGDHDTRDNFTSLEAHVMGDADRLWRFTAIECENYGWKPQDFIAKRKADLAQPTYLLTEAGRRIAEIELKNTEAYFRHG